MDFTYLDIYLKQGDSIDMSLSERLLLGVYLFRANDDGTCDYGYAGIGKQIGKDKANVKKLCDSLRAKGLIRLQGTKGIVINLDELMKRLYPNTASSPAKGGADDSPEAEKPTTPPPEVSGTPGGSNMHPPKGGSRHPPYKHIDEDKQSNRRSPNPPRGVLERARVRLDSSDKAFYFEFLKRTALVAVSARWQVQLLKKGRQCTHCGYSIDQIRNAMFDFCDSNPQPRTITEDAKEALNIMDRMIAPYRKTHSVPPQVTYDFEPFLAKYPKKPSILQFFLEQWCRLTDAGITPAQLLSALDEAMRTPYGLVLYENKIARPGEWLYAKAKEWLQ